MVTLPDEDEDEIAPTWVFPNLDTVKDRIRAYYGDHVGPDGRHRCSFTSRWAQDVAAVIAAARSHLDRRLADGVENPALVLDVDDTALTTYPHLANNGFGMRQNRLVLPAIPATLDLACHADAHGVAVFYVTARLAERRDDTLANLRHAGYPEPAGLYLLSGTPAPDGMGAFKAGVRARIESCGYRIVVSVGDQPSDVTGGHAEASFQLPNPIYLTP